MNEEKLNVKMNEEKLNEILNSFEYMTKEELRNCIKEILIWL